MLPLDIFLNLAPQVLSSFENKSGAPVWISAYTIAGHHILFPGAKTVVIHPDARHLVSKVVNMHMGSHMQCAVMCLESLRAEHHITVVVLEKMT